MTGSFAGHSIPSMKISRNNEYTIESHTTLLASHDAGRSDRYLCFASYTIPSPLYHTTTNSCTSLKSAPKPHGMGLDRGHELSEPALGEVIGSIRPHLWVGGAVAASPTQAEQLPGSLPGGSRCRWIPLLHHFHAPQWSHGEVYWRKVGWIFDPHPSTSTRVSPTTFFDVPRPCHAVDQRFGS